MASTPRPIRPGEDPTPPSSTTTPSALGPPFAGTPRFELRRVLGEGGMGVVYEALDRERSMSVALKTLRHLDAQNLFRLKTEFRAHADLEHRNLVRLGELHHHAGHWFFTMELVEGHNFIDWCRADPTDLDRSSEVALDAVGPGPRRYDERRVRLGLRQLAHGLDFLHRSGKVHRDLKPSNVLVTGKDRVVILDLGLVAEVARRDVSDHNVVGTAPYVAPEQALNGSIGPPADWYSVGVMLYEALTGRLPIDGNPLDILLRKQHEQPLPPDRQAAVAPDLSALCVDLLAIDPMARPDGAAVLRRLAAPAPLADDGPAPFVGRTDELHLLAVALDDVAGGNTVTVRIEGASGIGKSSLVREFVDRVVRPRPGTLVLTGRCHERESVPFKGVDGVVDSAARALIRIKADDNLLPPPAETAALAQMFPVLLRVPAVARVSAIPPASPFELRARAFRGLRLLLRALADRRLLVIAIDDVQWADPDSLMLLREILHAPGAPHALVILTWRGAGSPPALPGVVRSVVLDRLSPEEARGLVELIAPERGHETAALVASSDGHPMFLRELLRHAAPLRGTRLDDALWARISRMEMIARRMLELVSVAGRPLPQGLVGEALGIDSRTSSKWLAVLRAASLVRTGGARGSDPVEPYHDRVREAVVARVASARRRRYHARLAAVLIASGLVDKDPLAVVLHLEAAGHLAQAADLARTAARRRARPPVYEQVAALCDAALRLGADGGDRDERRDLLIGRAEALAYAARGREAATAFLDAAEQLDHEEAFQCRRAAAEQLLISGYLGDGLRLLRDVATEIGERFPATPAAARRALMMRWLLLAVRGTRFQVATPTKARASELRRLDVYRTASLGLGMIDPLVGAGFGAKAALGALRAGDQRRIAYALANHAMYVASAGGRHVASARKVLARAVEVATACRSRFLLGWARAGEGVVEYFGGNLLRAIDVLVDAEEQLRGHTVGSQGELSHLRMFLLFAMRRHGSYDELRTRYDEYVRDAVRRGDRYSATTFRWSTNVVWLAADDVERARADLEACVWSSPAQGLHLQHWFCARAWTELALYNDDEEGCAHAEVEMSRFTSVLSHVGVVRSETGLELARIAVRRRDPAGARRALVSIRRDRTPYLRASAGVLWAAVDELEGRRDAARARLERVLAATGPDLPVVAALVLRRLGTLTTGVAGQRLAAEADALLLHHGVVAPARFARVFATWPGDFDR